MVGPMAKENKKTLKHCQRDSMANLFFGSLIWLTFRETSL